MYAMVEACKALEIGTNVVPEARPSRLTTTLYDLVAAVQAVVQPEEDELVVATVMHMLGAGHSTFLGGKWEAFCQ
ncbi:MAG TPA: hypothetical protein VIH59_34280 [Candidatus Tectomicrobia bacterium]|jgi:hypothetical protein